MFMVITLWGWCSCGRVGAADLVYPTGSLATNQTSATTSANTVQVNGATALYVEYVIDSGTATIELQQKLKNGTNYQTVSGSSQSSETILKIDNPAGTFQAEVTACSSCDVSVIYQAAYQKQWHRQHDAQNP